MSNKDGIAIANEIKVMAGLSTDAKIVLHTRIVQSLFNGSWKRGRMGLLQFAKTISALWQAAKEDDPYAEWYLLKTYQALFDARNHLKAMEDAISNCLNTLRGVEVTPFECITPITYPLNFSTPFGYMGAYLIADADFVLRQLLTLERVGIPLPGQDISFKSIVRHVQEAFAVPRNWARTGIKRKDIREQNDKFKVVAEKFGILPESVMEKKISFAFLPKTKE